MPQIDPTLRGTVRIDAEQDAARPPHAAHKVIQAAKRRDDTLRRQFQRAQALDVSQRPSAGARDRLRLVPNRYGPALVDRLLEDLPLDMGHHWVLAI